ncbi:hypothetical protein ACWEDZ_38150 [Streptomyces sp. NPDC005047]
MKADSREALDLAARVARLTALVTAVASLEASAFDVSSRRFRGCGLTG